MSAAEFRIGKRWLVAIGRDSASLEVYDILPEGRQRTDMRFPAVVLREAVTNVRYRENLDDEELERRYGTALPAPDGAAPLARREPLEA